VRVRISWQSSTRVHHWVIPLKWRIYSLEEQYNYVNKLFWLQRILIFWTFIDQYYSALKMCTILLASLPLSMCIRCSWPDPHSSQVPKLVACPAYNLLLNSGQIFSHEMCCTYLLHSRPTEFPGYVNQCCFTQLTHADELCWSVFTSCWMVCLSFCTICGHPFFNRLLDFRLTDYNKNQKTYSPHPGLASTCLLVRILYAHSYK